MIDQKPKREVRPAPAAAHGLREQILVGPARARLWAVPHAPDRAWLGALPFPPRPAAVHDPGDDDLTGARDNAVGERACGRG
jgi:hypothetical protein